MDDKKYVRDLNHQYTEFYTNKVSKHFSLPLTHLFLRLGFSANLVTYLMWITGILGALCFISPEWNIRLLGCFLLFMINVLDTSDGEVARYLDTCSPFGVALDKIVHFTTNQILFFSIAFGLFLADGSIQWFILGFFLILATSSDEILKELYAVQVKQIKNDEMSSKMTKMALSYNRDSLPQFLVHITFSGTAFYHLFTIFVLLDIFLMEVIPHTFFFEILYLGIFLLVNILKVSIRYRSVSHKLRALK